MAHVSNTSWGRLPYGGPKLAGAGITVSNGLDPGDLRYPICLQPRCREGAPRVPPAILIRLGDRHCFLRLRIGKTLGAESGGVLGFPGHFN